MNKKILTAITFCCYSQISFSIDCAIGPVYAYSPYNLKCIEFNSVCEIPDGMIQIDSCNINRISPKANMQPKDVLNRPALKQRDSSDLNQMVKRASNQDLDTFTAAMRKAQEKHNTGPGFTAERESGTGAGGYYFGR